MSELPTYEQASRCPRCDMPGQKMSENPVPTKPGVKIHVLRCVTSGCSFEGMNFLVQVNPDGSVPPPLMHNAEDKLYPASRSGRTSTEEEQRLQAYLERLKRDAAKELRPGTEVKNPYAR